MAEVALDGYPNEDRITYLRQLRVEFLDFQELLEGAIKGEIVIDDYKGYIERTIVDIDLIIGKLGDGDSSKADIVRSIKNMWEQMKVNPIMKRPSTPSAVESDSSSETKPNTQPAAIPTMQTQDLLHHINMLKGRIRKIVFLISLLTIPERLNRWLENAWPGYYIPFHLVFEDEIPTSDDRVRVLKYLAYSPARIKKGIICPGSGLIYRCEKDWQHQIPYVFGLVVIFAIITGIVLASSSLSIGINLPLINEPIKWEGWPNGTFLLFGWVAILLGIIVHAAIGAAKVEQKEGMPPLISAKGILPYISAKFGWLVWKLLIALIGLFGLAFSGIAKDLGPEVLATNAFLVGYSLDSVVELFGISMEQKAASQVSGLKKQLGLSEEK